ncbi:MAG: D-alanine--D-alanine ligase [Bacteroidetes bacterium]|nr:D-alanine--D-alanine ligase [Bacteroidota bacterium]
MSRTRVGIFFGGRSREREVSFAGGRTVYDNLDKSLFEAIPIFVDSFGNFIQVDWQYVYKGSIRDFYPPASFLPASDQGFQIYAESLNPDKSMQMKMAEKIGKIIAAESLPEYMDFAFLALHGSYGEDGSIQGLLEWLQIPYSGSGIFASALGMNKARQKDFQERSGLYVNHYQLLKRDAWVNATDEQKGKLYKYYNVEFGERFVIKPANQGSSLGVSVLQHPDYLEFEKAMDFAFFRQFITASEWNAWNAEEKTNEIKQITDIRSGIGLPLALNDEVIYLPATLLSKLDQLLSENDEILLESLDAETDIVVEEFIEGREFSCIVVRDDLGNPFALPPTEIKKNTQLYDYRSKYLPGLSKKETPIKASDKVISEIRDACISLYDYFGFNVYARIDGFVTEDEEIYLNDPNTTSGMMPSSFFFHQAAEIGLNPSQFLTFIIRNSLAERLDQSVNFTRCKELLQSLDAQILAETQQTGGRKKIAVIMGGYSFERHISMESGRNIYEKLSSSEQFAPVPFFLTGDRERYELYRIPVNIMLKDNADDVKEKVSQFKMNSTLLDIISDAQQITEKYNPEGAVFEPVKTDLNEIQNAFDGVFIALHGRPGEDGTLQKELKKLGIYYNGSDAHSSEITINKYVTNEKLRQAGFLVADHGMFSKTEWLADPNKMELEILNRFGVPLIAKPADDGCSAAVRKLKTQEELHQYLAAIFRSESLPTEAMRVHLSLLPNEEFPAKEEILIEKFVEKGDAIKFLEVTGGMLTHLQADGTLRYEIFEPSESLAETEILSLEEKFLAGEGQNITPSRFSNDALEQSRISTEVRNTLEAVAKTLEVTGYCRIDAFVRIFEDGKVETVIIEVNSLPGMTPATCIYHQAALNGYKPYDFIREILNFGEQTRTLNA